MLLGRSALLKMRSAYVLMYVREDVEDSVMNVSNIDAEVALFFLFFPRCFCQRVSERFCGNPRRERTLFLEMFGCGGVFCLVFWSVVIQDHSTLAFYEAATRFLFQAKAGLAFFFSQQTPH